MNTVQKYSGEGDSTISNEPTATLITQTAPSAAQAPSSINERQAYFQSIATSKDASDYLHDVIDLLADHSQEPNPVTAINELSASLLSPLQTNWDDPNMRRNLRTVLELGAFMTRLRETYAGFESEADLLAEKEDEHE